MSMRGSVGASHPDVQGDGLALLEPQVQLGAGVSTLGLPAQLLLLLQPPAGWIRASGFRGRTLVLQATQTVQCDDERSSSRT